MKYIAPIFALVSFIATAASLTVLGATPLVAVTYGLAVGLSGGGVLTLIKRYLATSERIKEDIAERSIEVNRAIFWKRIFTLATLTSGYFVIMSVFLGATPEQALALLPSLLFQGVTQGAFLVLLLGANFMLMFGPFLLFAKMGKETYEPGDASWDTKISDVRGQKSAVEEMKRLLRLFNEGRHFVKAGGKREKGAILVGPPGTGKTMLAKAIASELQMPIIVASGASFGGIFFGMDAVAVWMMMRNLRKKAKRWGGAVAFIDEIDALAANRGGMGGGAMGGMMGGMGGGGMGLNMLLTQMDGVDSPGFFKKLFRRFLNVTLDGLFVPRKVGPVSLRIPALKPPRYNLFFLGATNRPQVLDPAVTRPGRFGRQITFRNPSKEARKDIAALYFDQKAHDPDMDTPERREEFARITEGHSPAEIEQILSLALVYAFEDARKEFTFDDVKVAIANVESGLAEAVEYSDRDKLGVARHELGHAVAAKFYEPDRSMARLSIRMRGGSLGHFYSLDKEEEFIKLRSQIRGRLVCILGAIASERVFYNENSAGVSMDLIQGTNTAASMIGVYGMGPELGLTKEVNKLALNLGGYLISLAEAAQSMLVPSSIAAVLASYRKPVAQVMGAAYIDAWRLMKYNKDAIDVAAKTLMEKGELVGGEVDDLLNSVDLKPVPVEFTEYPDSVQELK